MKAATKSRASAPSGSTFWWLWAAALLVVCLSLLFWKSFDPAYVHFSNDGPLGAMVAEQNAMPASLTGLWVDLNWLGSEGISPAPSLTTLMRCLVSPDVYARFLPPVALLIFGLSACWCFRQFKLAPLACALGGLAAALNSDFFSTCTWGVASQVVGFGANYIALGLLVGNERRSWPKIILAGLAIGVGIMEAYDIGAIFSLFIAAFIFYDAVFLQEKISRRNVRFGITRIAIVAVFAAFISAHALTTLIGTQLKGVVLAERDMQTAQQRWDYATQWSLPKVESLQIIIPGIFGYRMESPHGDNYWGTIGADPKLTDAEKQLTDPDPQIRAQAKETLGQGSNWRISGTGYYAGVSVVLIALWAVLQSFRREHSPFSLMQRRTIWFWSGVIVISLPLAFGRYAPFYQLFYALPYASTIRNPTKFLHVFHWSLVLLFAHGVHGLVKLYFQNSSNNSVKKSPSFKNRISSWDRRFVVGGLCATVLSVIAWCVYSTANVQAALREHMQHVGIDPLIAAPDAIFSLHAVGWFVFLLALTLGLFTVIITGQFKGNRARWGGLLLGVLVVLDLARADAPWVQYWNIAYKYATNPVLDLLRDQPYEHRVDILPFGSYGDQMKLFRQVYMLEWTQQLFTYYNIQSLQVISEPRLTVDKFKFLNALPWSDPANIVRTWELTNTRYLIGDGTPDFLNALNQKFDPLQHRFRALKFPDGQTANFNLVPKTGYPGTAFSDYTAAPAANGQRNVIEFTGALPRAKLFSNWQINTNDDTTLALLASHDFDPHRAVLVADPQLPAPAPADTFRDPGTVTITTYHPKHIELVADVQVPAVLLLSERYNPKWQVQVDGQPTTLLRCNYIMRGIHLIPGHHTVILRYVQPLGTLYVSVTAIFLGLILVVWQIKSKLSEQPVP